MCATPARPPVRSARLVSRVVVYRIPCKSESNRYDEEKDMLFNSKGQSSSLVRVLSTTTSCSKMCIVRARSPQRLGEASNAARKLDILHENRDSLRVDGAEIGILEEVNEVGLGSLL